MEYKKKLLQKQRSVGTLAMFPAGSRASHKASLPGKHAANPTELCIVYNNPVIFSLVL